MQLIFQEVLDRFSHARSSLLNVVTVYWIFVNLQIVKLVLICNGFLGMTMLCGIKMCGIARLRGRDLGGTIHFIVKHSLLVSSS